MSTDIAVEIEAILAHLDGYQFEQQADGRAAIVDNTGRSVYVADSPAALLAWLQQQMELDDDEDETPPQFNGAAPPLRVAGALRSVIKAAKRTTRENLADLTVLSPQNDPYRIDTPAGHRVGQWFAEQVARFVPDDGTIHLRGLHYRISSVGAVLKPGGKALRKQR